MSDQIITTLGITSPILLLIATALYFLFKKLLEDRFDIVKNKEIESIKQVLAKNMQLFEKEKEALSGILSAISTVIIRINASFDFINLSHRLVSQKQCDELELVVSQHILFLKEENQQILDFFIKVLRANSSWIIEATGDHELFFSTSDLALLEYLQKRIQAAFKAQLFQNGRESLDDITLLEIAFLAKFMAERKKINKAEIEHYDYGMNPIQVTIENIKNESRILISIFKRALAENKDSSDPSNYWYEQMQKIRFFVSYLEKYGNEKRAM